MICQVAINSYSKWRVTVGVQIFFSAKKTAFERVNFHFGSLIFEDLNEIKLLFTSLWTCSEAFFDIFENWGLKTDKWKKLHFQKYEFFYQFLTKRYAKSYQILKNWIFLVTRFDPILKIEKKDFAYFGGRGFIF